MKVRNNVDYSNKDYDSFRRDMIVRLQQKIPEYTDTSESDFGIVLIELLAHGLDLLSYYNDRVAREMFLDSARERDSVVSIASNILGYEVKENTPSQFYQVFKITPTDKVTIIPKGTQVKTMGDSEGSEESVIFETIEDLHIPAGHKGTERDSEGDYLHKVLVEQGESHNNIVLGTSTGEGNQEFYVPSTGVIKNSVEVYVIGENGMPEKWERVSNFIASKTDDKHFVVRMLDDDIAVVKFGNGKSGKIPYDVENGITVNFKVGGGSKGNVSPFTITEFVDSDLAYVETFNPYPPYTSGVDKETIEELVINAPASLKTKWGAITTEDYRDLIIGESFVQDVTAYNDSSNPLLVHVTLLPRDYENITDEAKMQIKEKVTPIYLSKKALGVSVSLDWAKVDEVLLYLKLKLDKTTSQMDTVNKVKSLIYSKYELSNRKLGESLYISDVIWDVMSVPGILNAYGNFVHKDEELYEVIAPKTTALTIVRVICDVTGGV